VHDLLHENRLTKLTLVTIYRWLDRLGFKYEPRRKCYYVDGHERPETKVYRRNFIKRYLEHENRMHRWIQFTIDEIEEMEQLEQIGKGLGFRYTNELTGIDMVEFHVDDHPSFLDRTSASTRFGGHLSVRKPPNAKPLICFGQDECIFKQYIFSHKSWTAPDGQKAVIPKDDGLGVMISAFVSREFGYGMELSPEELQQVNNEREGKDYSDQLAATSIRGRTVKQELTESPFAIEFEYGANGQGYWETMTR
jgi:hypothetical protein